MKYLILGAGPAGLAFANRLKRQGESSFIVIEKESEAGGLCRSKLVDGFPFDIGGGHFLDIKRPEVNKFLFSFMPEDEWNIYERDSKIYIHNEYINSPFESNIWQMEIEKQIAYLKDIAIAGCNLGNPIPEKFIDWIYWKLGNKIAEDYMLPYNKKMFSEELNELGTYWLDKLPNVSFEETLLSCLVHKAYGTQPGHAQFYYPKKYGYGELWLRMASEIKEHIIYNAAVSCIDFKLKEVKTISNDTFQADIIINTIPWIEFNEMKNIPIEIKSAIKKLKYNSIETRYFADNINTNAQWIYYPDLELPYHRILVRHNFCHGSRGYWTETRMERTSMFQTVKSFSYLNQYAYPLNTIEKPKIMSDLLNWAVKYDVYGLGRWGEHQHYNSDVTVEKAINLADKFLKSNEKI